MSDVWITVGALTIGTAAIRASGPVLLGGRRLSASGSRASSRCSRRPCSPRSSSSRPSGRRRVAPIEFDARIVGVGAAALALFGGAGTLRSAIIAAVVTALVRLIA